MFAKELSLLLVRLQYWIWFFQIIHDDIYEIDESVGAIEVYASIVCSLLSGGHLTSKALKQATVTELLEIGFLGTVSDWLIATM